MTTPKNAGQSVRSNPLLDIFEHLRTQDNRATAEPMFCVQEHVRDVGYDANYADGNTIWINMESGDYEEVPPNTPGAEEFGFKERWETVMVCFTEEGCKDYLRQNGHNHKGKTRIYVESFRRCDEMIKIRNWLMFNASLSIPGGETRYAPGDCSLLFVVLAFRYGGMSNVFPIGVFASRAAAAAAAKKHRDYRGGKYDHRIYEFIVGKLDDDVGHKWNNRLCIEANARLHRTPGAAAEGGTVRGDVGTGSEKA